MLALEALTSSVKPPVLLVRSEKIFVAKYIFGDASGSGFGTTEWNDNRLSVEFGTWTEDTSNKSSNYREFANLVEKLERESDKGHLDGAEVFVFTDNATTEAAFNNATTSSKILFDLIL